MGYETDPLLYKSPNPDEALNLVGSKITRYVTEVGHFEKMVPRYGSPQDTTEFRKQINAKREELSHMYKVIVHDVQELKSVVHGMPKIKLDKMTDQFEQTHKEYQKYSESSIQKDRIYHPIFVEPPHNPVKEYQQSQPSYQQQEEFVLYAEDPVAAAVEERNKDVAQVARDMALLKELYVDVNKLAVEQGLVLEQVHKNTTQADQHVEAGVKELKQAEKYTHSYRKKVVVLGMLLLLILIAVGLVLYFYLR